MSRQLRLDVAQLTDVGRKRPHNEDNMAHVIPMDEQVMAKKGALFIVADGMGGHAAGEVASEIAVQTVSVAYYQDENDEIPVALKNAIKRANALIRQRAAENMLRSGMGTTCISAVLHGNMAYIANVGDSRAYLVRHGQVRQVSQDHSWVEEQVRAGLLTREQARSHAQRNVITRCLGTQTDVEVDVFPERLEDGDTLILCSDGLSGSILEEDLRSIVAQYLPQESVYHLVERANENGGLDNITTIVVRVQEVGEPSSNTLHPVYVGGHEINEEDTAVVERVPSAPLNVSAPHPDHTRVPSVPLPPVSGPLFSAATTPLAPRAVITPSSRRRSRLLYPTLALLVLLIVALLGGGVYYFFHLSNDVGTKLNQADTLIHQAHTTTATEALQKLSSAQQDLLAIPGNLLIGAQAKQFSQLQSDLTTGVKHAIALYNQQALIDALPCGISQNTVVQTGQSSLMPTTLVTLQDANHQSVSYTLGNDHNLYFLDGQHHMVKTSILSSSDQPFLLASNTQALFTLNTAPGQANAYSVSMLMPQSSTTLKANNTSITPSVLSGGWTPQLLAASDADVYVILTSKTSAHQALILDYPTAVDQWQNPAQHETISLSPDPVSAVAVPGKQLFLLTNDGHVKRLLFTPDTGDTPQPVQSTATEIPLPQKITTPLAVDAHTFTWNTPLMVPVSQTAQFINISGATLLAASTTNGTTLFIADNVNHRVVQLHLSDATPATTPTPTATPAASPTASPTPSATATASANGGGVINNGTTSSWQLIRQYASPSLLPSIKSIGIDPQGKQLSLLSQNAKNSASLVQVDVTQTQGCTTSTP